MRIGRGRRSDAGGALVELALVMPVIILIFVGTIDFGRVFYTSQALTDAARAGAQYGAKSPASSGDTAGMESTATTATNTTGIVAVATRLCQCANDSGAFSATSPSANNCSSPSATSCPSGHLVVTVTVTTSKTFNTLMAGGLPGFMQSINLSRSATLRAQ